MPYLQERSHFGHILETETNADDSLNLSKKIKELAKLKQNNPLTMTTERNLRKIKENSLQKIKNQIRFSKRNDLLFKNPGHHFDSVSLEFDLTTMGNTPGQNNSVYSNYRGSSLQGSVPEGVN